MYQIDNSTATTTKPTRGATGPNVGGYFTGGNPATSTPATIVDPDWMNMLQDEFSAILAAAGIAQNKSNDGQLLQALQSGALTFGTDSGTAGAYVVAATNAPATLTNGMRVAFFANAGPNAGACTLNYAGLGVKSLLNVAGAAFTGGEIVAGQSVLAVYNGVAFQAVNTKLFDFDVSRTNITASATVSPTAYETVVSCANGSAITVTLGAGKVPGQRVTVLGSGAAPVTVASAVSSGQPAFWMPDGSEIYSVVLADAYGAAFEAVWDGNGWRARTIGQEIVANAIASNHAVALGQFKKTGSTAWVLPAATAAAGTVSCSGTRTLPDGRLVNWAVIQLVDSTNVTWTFPTAFGVGVTGMRCFNLSIATGQTGTANVGIVDLVSLPTLNSVELVVHNTTVGGTLVAFYVEAEGY